MTVRAFIQSSAHAALTARLRLPGFECPLGHMETGPAESADLATGKSRSPLLPLGCCSEAHGD